MIRRTWQFITALAKSWGTLVTGGLIIGIIGVLQLTGHPVKLWVGWGIVVGGIIAACFVVWNKQRDELERFKTAWQDEVNKPLNMRRAIYKELFFLYATIRSIMNEFSATELAKQSFASLAKTLRTDAYQFAKSQPNTFYRLPEAYKIDGLYGHLTVVQQMESINPESVVQILTYFLEKTEEALRDPVFDLKLFQSIMQEAKEAFAREIAKEQLKASSPGSQQGGSQATTR